MTFDLASIVAETSLKPPRIILLGVEKIGKSTFAADAPNTVFIPIAGEEGIDALSVAKFPVCQTRRDVSACLSTLHQQAHTYQTVVIDSASALEPILWKDVCEQQGNVSSIEKVGGGYGKGYTEALLVWRNLTQALDILRHQRGMTSIIIGHVKVKRFDDPCGNSYDQYQFDINDRAANLLYRWADLILFCNTKVVVKTEDVGFNKEKHQGIDLKPGARYLYTQKRAAHPGGGRGIFGQLPYELPLSWNSFIDAVTAGK